MLEADGQLILITNGVVENFPEGIYRDRNGHLFPLDSSTIHALSGFVHIKNCQGCKLCANLAPIAHALRNSQHSVLKNLREGVLDTTYLINTDGGYGSITAQIVKIINDIRERGGRVRTMVSQRAHSAGARLFGLLSPDRTIPAHATCLWHAGVYGMVTTKGEFEEIPELAARSMGRDTRKNLAFFGNAVQDPCALAIIQKRFRAAMDDPQNTLNDVLFTGAELGSFGMARCLTNVRELEENFCDTTGVDPLSIRNPHAVALTDFFNQAHLSDRLRTLYGLACYVQPSSCKESDGLEVKTQKPLSTFERRCLIAGLRDFIPNPSSADRVNINYGLRCRDY